MTKGKRDCEGRYQAIADYLHNRSEAKADQMRVLDFGAQAGYFAQRLAEDFDAEVVAIDTNRKTLSRLRHHPKIRVKIAHYSPANLRALGHFDVVLGLSVLHHQPRWRDYLDVLTEIGDIVFIEVSHPDEVLPKAVAHGEAQDIGDAVEALAYDVLVQTPGYDDSCDRPLFVIDAALTNAPVTTDSGRPTDSDQGGEAITDNPVPEAVVEQRKETQQNFADDVPQEAVISAVASAEEFDKPLSAQERQREGDGGQTPKKRGRKPKGEGLSDSQHE